MTKKCVTRKDVAERAGVSTSVVSYVVNNGPKPVAPKTRAKVEKAIEELGYYPNELARSLKLKQTLTVGLIIPNLNNPVYAEIAISMESVCRAEGYLVLLCNSGRDGEQEREFVRMLRSKQVDGVVMIPSQDPLQLIQPLQSAHIPTVILEHNLPEQHCIVVDDLNGGRIGTQHLLDLGHRRIAMIDRTRHSQTSTLRLVGYRQALEDAGISFDPELVVKCEAGYVAAFQAMRQLLALEPPPTAVFTHNDVQALAALHAIQSANLSIPGDISIIGYDDTASSAFLSPPLTTVRFPKKEMGEQAAKMVMQLAKHEETLPAQTTILPVELVVRGSTAPPPYS